MNPSLTIRQAAEQIYTPDQYARTSRHYVSAMIAAWERLTSNPPISAITNEMVEKFENDLEEIGITASRTYRDFLQAILNRERGVDRITRRGPRRGRQPAPTAIDGTLASYFHCMYKPRRLAGKSPNTATNYEINLRHWERCIGHAPKLDDLTDDGIIVVMEWLRTHGRSVVTCNKFRVHAVSLWNFLARKGVVKTFPDVQPFKAPQRTPRAWTEPQLRKLYEACGKQTGTICGLPAAEWWTCLHDFLWFTSERLNAALCLRPCDVDLETGWIHVPAEFRKGQTRDRDYRLKGGALERLRAFIELDPTRARVFPEGACRETTFNRYVRILRAAGLSTDRASKFHRMRRSSLTHLQLAGGDATRQADHSSPAVTRKSYLDPTILVEQQAADVLFDPIGGAS